ncbi:MAG: SMI1/KNR4 family protein [Clostridium sp.]|nr:SMI1/KNR4 family protein [Clostridium sp.]
MTIQENTVIQPVPSAELLAEKERKWRLVLPADYRDFIIKYNGGIPNEASFECGGRSYAITRFLCILQNVQESPHGIYDIGAVESQIGERLTDNEDLIGIEVLPIAELFAGDYVCLDYREDQGKPCICVWSHEESGDFEPVTYKVANTFSEFVQGLV